MNDTTLFVCSPDDVKLSEKELAARLKMPADEIAKIISPEMPEIKKTISFKAAYKYLPFKLIGGSTVAICNGAVKSASLARFLKNASGCIFMAATIGMGVERYLNALSSTYPASHYIADAVTSAYIESFCDTVQNKIAECFNIDNRRFSPGYGDLDLGFQKILLGELNASRLLGITLTDSMMMIPRKSVTAIIGVK